MSATHAYLATKPCGCAPWICVDDCRTREQRADLARSVAEHIRDGYAVERLPAKQAAQRFGWCPEHKPATQEEML